LPDAFPTLDFHEFHRSELPRRLASGHGALAAKDDLERIGPLAFRIREGGAYTYIPKPGGVEIVEGEDAARTVIEISRDLWQDVVHELESPPGLLYGGKVACPRGNAMRFVRWEPALRAMYQGRPIFDPGRVLLRDRAGAPLDVRQSFRLDDDPEAMAHFLRTTGFLLAREVFSGEEVAEFRRHGDALRAKAVEGDKKSWWGKNRAGDAVLCRVTHAGRIPQLKSLAEDPRLRRLAALSDHELVPRGLRKEDGVSLLIKNPEMVEGLSDIPWHRDCGMGGHASMCPILIFSIYLQPSRPESGELRMLAGSHESSYGFIDPNDPTAPKGVRVEANPGDVSIHYGDIMHAAPPPTSSTGPFRQCLLIGYARPEAYNHRGDSSYNDVLLSRDDGQVEHLEDLVVPKN
jgi:ectoine hydroxylase-related dioxygenase (phytanoyl-CoA dioxygenase family)